MTNRRSNSKTNVAKSAHEILKPLAMDQISGYNDVDVWTVSIYHVPKKSSSGYALNGGDSGWRVRAVKSDQSPVWNGEDDATISKVPAKVLANFIMQGALGTVSGCATMSELMPEWWSANVSEVRQ